MRIPLPIITETTGERRAHPFPLQIAFQTLELMQASVFHAMLLDEAAGQRVRQPNGVEEVDEALLRAGLNKAILDQGWKFLGKYQTLFDRFATQSVLIALRSQWDWYIRNIGRFILASKRTEAHGALSRAAEKNLKTIGFKDIHSQISVLLEVKIDVWVPESVSEAVREMSLVRNLGLHNRWEVDGYYVKESKTSGWNIGEIRVFEASEIEKWHQGLVWLVKETWPSVAERFKDAPDFNI
jgi:hypothetical protein